MQSDSQALEGLVAKDVIAEMAGTCLLMRTRLISRVITGIYDEQLRPFGISAVQFVLLVAIYRMEPATRAEIGRSQHHDRSTLTRNLRAILAEGWAEEIQHQVDDPIRPDGRSRPMVLTKAGKDLLRNAERAWRAAEEQAKSLLGKDGESRSRLSEQ
jgi:DNA-binding MarR family transcriptional regulator